MKRIISISGNNFSDNIHDTYSSELFYSLSRRGSSRISQRRNGRHEKTVAVTDPAKDLRGHER